MKSGNLVIHYFYPFSNERLLKRIQRRVRAFGFHQGVCVLKQITTTTTENS